MLKYQYKFLYSNGHVTLYRRKSILGIIPFTSWSSQTSPFNSLESLHNICQRRCIKKNVLENING